MNHDTKLALIDFCTAMQTLTAGVAREIGQDAAGGICNAAERAKKCLYQEPCSEADAKKLLDVIKR